MFKPCRHRFTIIRNLVISPVTIRLLVFFRRCHCPSLGAAAAGGGMVAAITVAAAGTTESIVKNKGHAEVNHSALVILD